MTHEPRTCKEHFFGAWTTSPDVPDGVTVQRLMRTCLIPGCGQVQYEDEAPNDVEPQP